MESYKYITHKLFQLGINQYNIVISNEKKLMYKNVFEKISYEELNLSEIFVILKIKDKISTFTMSSTLGKDLIDEIIQKSIANAFSLNFDWDNIDKIKKQTFSTNKLDHIFNKFDIKSYLSKIHNEIERVQKATSLTLNTAVNIRLYQNKLITTEVEYIQYHFSSKCICMENKNFSKKALLQNFTSLDNLSTKIVNKLNEEINFLPKKIEHSTILIKDVAVSQIVNLFISQFYADNVYLGNSIIKNNSLGKRIINNNICLESFPYEGNVFDGEGSYIRETILLKDGYLCNLLSNKKFSNYLKLKNSGNASFTFDKKITHQILKFNVHNMLNGIYLNPTVIVNRIENININPINSSITMIANCCDKNGTYCTSVNFDLKNFFDNIYSTGKELNLIDNVFCQDIIYSAKNH